MSTQRKSFILHTDSLAILEKLTNEQAGQLIKAMHQYNLGIDNELDPLIDIVFTPFKLQFDRDAEKYKSITERNKANGKGGGRPKQVDNQIDGTKPTETQTNPEEPKKPSGLSGNPKNLDNDSVSDSVNDSDSKNDNESNLKEKIDFPQLLKYFNKTFNKECRVVNEKVKKKYQSLLKQNYTKDDIGAAMIAVKNDDWHKEKNYQYATLEFFSRPETIDKYGFGKIKPIKNPDDWSGRQAFV